MASAGGELTAASCTEKPTASGWATRPVPNALPGIAFMVSCDMVPQSDCPRNDAPHQGMFVGSPIGPHALFGDSSLLLFLLRLVCSAILLLESSVCGGSIEPDLAAELSSASPQELMSVVIDVTGGISAAELNAFLDSACETLSDRRREGVLLLQERANDTQEDLLISLQELKQAGLAKNIESHWLVNTITADLTSGSVEAVAYRPDVKEVFRYPEIVSIEPIRHRSSTSSAITNAGGVEENLIYIGADSAWRMGYTGRGRIVCHFDSEGVEGKHPALFDNWKGHDGNPDAAWWGEWTADGYPAPRGTHSHGTHVVGIMVGHDDIAGDTIGVAPDAKWIGAGGPGWEWAANPDGDPYVTDDVPDVINISFATGHNSCWDRYWDMIDMTEALGIVNIIAAGNNGSSPYSVAGPGSRALDSLTNFAVGSINHESGLVWWSSSRGPSHCDSISIKPNVTAPGVSIRSSITGGLYEKLGGTSMAAPHVSGAVAILRQYAPNASVREIKEALLAGCTPRGNPSPNNNYGWGVINIPASIDFLSSHFDADVRIVAFDYVPANYRDTVKGEIALKNRGYPVDSVYIRFANDNDGISVLTDSIHFGAMNRNQAADGNIPFEVIFNDTMYAGATVSLNFTIHGANGYLRHSVVPIRAGLEGERSFFTHKNSMFQLTVSNFGQYSDFRYVDTSQNWLYDAALMIGTDYEHVSDAFRNASRESDDDFWHDVSCSLEVATPGMVADQETSCIFDDGLAENRLGIQVKQNTYSWDTAPDDKFVVMEYVIENVSSRIIDGISVGLALDWTYQYPNHDRHCEGNFSRAENLGFLFKHTSATDSSSFRGATVLNEEGVLSYQVIAQELTGYVSSHRAALSDSAKYTALAGGFIDTNLVTTNGENLLHAIATGPFLLSPGESDTAYFAILGAESLAEMKSTALQAREKALSLIEAAALPRLFELRQNYPNPFNSTTRIEFVLREPGHVTFKVFNILGQQVATLVDRSMLAGHHTVAWAGTDNRGKRAATGIYLYRLIMADYSETRKMLLLK